MEYNKFIVNKSQNLIKAIQDNISNISYNTIMTSLRNKDVKINGKRVNNDCDVAMNNIIEIYYKSSKNIEPCSIIFQDENILVIDKKSGFSSEDTFSFLQKKYSEIYFIHRLDRNTSGLMIFALNKVSETELLTGFKNRNFDKKYLAEVYGIMSKKSDILTAYLVKDSNNSLVKIYDKKISNSVEIKTGYEVIREKQESSELLVTLYTGKTHQIRAHLAHIGHFIIGDGKYGDNKVNKKFEAKSQRLSAVMLTLKFNEDSPLNYLNNKTFSIKD